MAGQKQIMPYIIRAANRKTFREIHQEIRAAQVQDVSKAVVGFSVPADLALQILLVDGREVSTVRKRSTGDGGITAIGMFGKGAVGASLQPAPTLTIIVGGIGEKPGVVDGHIAIREYLSMTISFDHDIIDGAPAARFTERLKELIESGYGLPTRAGRSGRRVKAEGGCHAYTLP